MSASSNSNADAKDGDSTPAGAAYWDTVDPLELLQLVQNATAGSITVEGVFKNTVPTLTM